MIFAVIIGFVAAFQLFEGQKTLDELKELDTQLFNAGKFPDLAAFSSNQEGALKLGMTLTEATLPEFSSSSTLPARESDDALFYLGSPPTTLTPNLTYQGWEGDKWTATPYRGFFVQQATVNGTPVTRFSPMLRVVAPDTGEKLTADLVGANFLVTRGEREPDPNEEPCMVDPMTGLSVGDLSKCTSFVVPAIKLRNGDGNPETVRLAELPAFTSPPTTTFTEGVEKTFAITATGAPLPTITGAGGSLPAGFMFNSTPDTGIGNLVYDGTTAIGASEHTVVLRATNGPGTASQSFTIRTGTELAFTSPDRFTFVAAKFGSFLVTTSGAPTPSIVLHPPHCVPGLSLTDNGDGTATFSGTPSPITEGAIIGCRRGFVAHNGVLPDDEQEIFVAVVRAPLAQLTSDNPYTLTLRLGEAGDEVLLNNIPFDCTPARPSARVGRARHRARLARRSSAGFPPPSRSRSQGVGLRL